MWTRWYRRIEELFNKQIDGTGLAVFRIAYSLVLLGEIVHIYYYRHLIFDKIPYLVPGEIDMGPALIIWMTAVIGLIFGFATKYVAIVNYILTVIVVGTTSSFEYHMFYAYLGINGLMIFLPVSRCLSLDRLRLKLKYSNTRFTYTPSDTVSSLAYLVPVLIGIGLVYFDSIFHKLASDFWFRGLGMWLPAVLPQTVFFDTTFIMNIKWLVLALGFLTLVFEASFIFLFWRKRWRLVCFIIGAGLHIGILICFPIPFFALGVTAIYILLVPVSFWKRVYHRRAKGDTSKLTFFYDAECPLCARTRIALQHFDTRNRIAFSSVQRAYESDTRIKGIPYETLLDNIYSIDSRGNTYQGIDTYIQVLDKIWYLKWVSWGLRIPGIYQLAKKLYRYIATNRTVERCTEDNCGYEIPPIPANDNNLKILKSYTLADFKVTGITIGLVVVLFFQLLSIYNSPFLNKTKEFFAVSENSIVKTSGRAAAIISRYAKTWFGITQHGVFMDWHFYRYNHSIGVVFIDENSHQVWLPLTEEDGKPGDYLIGHNWVKYTFRVNAPTIDQDILTDGLRDFTAFWAHKNGVDLDDARFLIKVKKNEQPTGWEKDFLHRQLANPWIDAGVIVWKDQQFEANIVNIEEL